MSFAFQKQIPSDSLVGADPKTIPHTLWHEWERELNREFLKITKVKNLIDSIWGPGRMTPRDYSIKTHPRAAYAGVSWQNKSEILRDHLRAHRCDAMVKTGNEIPFACFNKFRSRS